ncbi:hypothetical protein RF11_08570 [Thelohanellus kitauei]|uniref:Uncharacterized protein n=1 Tax=Thelohanellus kitauei TaxID=669202 RepID=A0A0C2I8Y3_THEKT|nr:hypothetical protein RF11_08570 [Thelohanellus kitauei]
MDYVRLRDGNLDVFDTSPDHIHHLLRYNPFLNLREEVFSHARSLGGRTNILRSANGLIQRMINACNLVTSKTLKNCMTLQKFPRKLYTGKRHQQGLKYHYFSYF